MDASAVPLSDEEELLLQQVAGHGTQFEHLTHVVDQLPLTVRTPMAATFMKTLHHASLT